MEVIKGRVFALGPLAELRRFAPLDPAEEIILEGRARVSRRTTAAWVGEGFVRVTTNRLIAVIGQLRNRILIIPRGDIRRVRRDGSRVTVEFDDRGQTRVINFFVRRELSRGPTSKSELRLSAGALLVPADRDASVPLADELSRTD
jgi:hypothetical protein